MDYFPIICFLCGMVAGALLYSWWTAWRKPPNPSYLIVDDIPQQAESDLELMKKDLRDRQLLKVTSPAWEEDL